LARSGIKKDNLQNGGVVFLPGGPFTLAAAQPGTFHGVPLGLDRASAGGGGYRKYTADEGKRLSRKWRSEAN